MRFLLLLFFVLILGASCSYFLDQEQKVNQLTIQRIDTINWNEIDSYPLFENCSELTPKIEQKTCFETIFTAHLIKSLKNYHFEVERTMSDTIYLEFKIDNEGLVYIYRINANDTIKKELIDLEKAIEVSVKTLPKLYAAQKKIQSDYNTQLIPVSTRFTLPIVLDIK